MTLVSSCISTSNPSLHIIHLRRLGEGTAVQVAHVDYLVLVVGALLVDDDHVLLLLFLLLLFIVVRVFFVRKLSNYLQAVLPIIYLGLVLLFLVLGEKLILVEGLEVCEAA